MKLELKMQTIFMESPRMHRHPSRRAVLLKTLLQTKIESNNAGEFN